MNDITKIAAAADQMCAAQLAHLERRRKMREFAKAIVKRCQGRGYKGQVRDKMAFEMWVGAALMADVAGDKFLHDHMSQIAVLLISTRGFSEVVRMAEDAQAC